MSQSRFSRSANEVQGMTNYDAIIIGTGQAGPFLAGRLAGAGRKVAIIERKLSGGTCIRISKQMTKYRTIALFNIAFVFRMLSAS